MPAVITCPECEKRFKGKPGLEGKRIRCPSCGHGFIVPGDDDEPGPPQKNVQIKPAKSAKPAAPAAPAPAPPVGFADEDDEDAEGSKYGITDLDLAPRCPNCTKELEPGAIICLHCGYNTQTRKLGKLTKTIEKTGNEHFMHLLPGLLVALCIVMVIIHNLWFCFEFPKTVEPGTFVALFAHESMKFWSALISLFLIWGLGMFCFKRLVLEPKPHEDIIED